MPGGLFCRAELLAEGGQHEKALAAFQQAVKSDAASARRTILWGWNRRPAECRTSAKASFSRALELQPNMLQATAALAALNAKGGQSG